MAGAPMVHHVDREMDRMVEAVQQPCVLSKSQMRAQHDDERRR